MPWSELCLSVPDWLPNWPITMLNGAELITRWGPLLLHHELLNPIITWAGEVWTNGVTLKCVRWYILWITQGGNWGLIHLWGDYQGTDYREMCELISCMIAQDFGLTITCLTDTEKLNLELLSLCCLQGYKLFDSVPWTLFSDVVHSI